MKTVAWMWLAWACFGPVAWAGGLSVPLKVTEPVGVERKHAPVTGGVPVGPLGIRSVERLVLLDAAGKPVAAQFSPMVKREDGTLAWVLVDFLADLKPKQTRTFRLGVGSPTSVSVANPVRVTAKGDVLTLSNGVLAVTLSKSRFDLFDRVVLGGKDLLAADPPPALTLVRGKDKKTFTTRDGKVDKVAFEDSGPVRTTLRIDGRFGDGKGETWLGYTARLTLWAGRPDVRVLYTLRNVNPKVRTAEQIRRASVTLRLARSKPFVDYLVGAARVNFSRLTRGRGAMPKGSQWHRVVRLEQVGPCAPVCSKSHRRFHKFTNFEDAGYRVWQGQPGGRWPCVDVGFRCSGWLEIAGDGGSVQLSLRNFTFDSPKRLEARADGTLVLDVLPVYEGSRQPYYKGGGYWLSDRTHKTFDMNFHFHPGPTLTREDWKRFSDRFQNYGPASPATAARAERAVLRARNPLQLVCTPEWYTRTGELWGVVPSLDDERAAAKALGRTKVGPRRRFPATQVATDYLHYEDFHGRSESDEARDELLEYLRTGEWHFYRRAHAFGRYYRDRGVHRTDGLVFGKRERGAWGAGPHGKCESCHHYGAGLIDLWLVTGDRSYLEAGLEHGYQHARSARTWQGFGVRNWGRKMAAVLAAYKATRDPKLKRWLVRNCRPRAADEARRADGRALLYPARLDSRVGSWMAGLCHHAIWHNWRMNGDEYQGVERDRYRDDLIGLARHVAKYWFFKEFNGGPYYVSFHGAKVVPKGGGGAYTSTCVNTIVRGYLLTGDPKLLAAAVKFWNAVNGPDPTVLSARLQDFHGMGSLSFWCRQLIYVLAHPRSDRTPPAAVTDLRAEALGGGRVRLTWTAPKDDRGVVAYQVKHAPLPIVAFDDYDYAADHGKKWTWWAAYNVAGEPAPARLGATQTMTVGGVPVGVRYFALRSRDAAPNESALSNVVRVEVR